MDFIDLASQQKRIRKQIDQNISRILSHGQYINGPEVNELEEKLAEFSGAEYAVGCSNGTDALLMCLMAKEVKPGDAIFTSPFTFISTAEVIQLLQAVPVFVDIDPHTFNMDTSKLEEAIKHIDKNKINPRGIIPVDIFGQPADYDEINEIAEKHGLFVIEDAAQSFGASYKNKRTCSLTDMATTSFYPAKPLGCYGDGGMIFTNDKDMKDILISIRDHGYGSEKYRNDRIGINGRLDSIQASIVLSKLEIFEDELERRQNISEIYNKGLKDVIEIRYIKEFNKSSWALYSVLSEDRDVLMKELKSEGIPSVIYYPLPLHLQKAFSHLGYKEGDFPVSENTCQKIFSLPMHPYLEQEDVEKVIEVIKGSSS